MSEHRAERVREAAAARRPAIGPLARLKALLARFGAAPRKKLGQNFLVDPNFAQAVAHAAAPDERTLIVEVGPGTGALTHALLEAHPQARVLAIELDAALCRLLRTEESRALAAGRLTLLKGDVLAGKHALNPDLAAAILRASEEEHRPRRVLCSNLAYNIAAPLIANLAMWRADVSPLPFGERAETSGSEPGVRGRPQDATDREADAAPLVEHLVVTVQLELAERLLGRPGTKDYGPLAVFLALRGEGRVLRQTGREIFWPRPRVSSAVLELRLPEWEQSRVGRGEARGFQAFLQHLFQHRRKTVRATLKDALPAGDARATRRAEDLTPEELLELFRKVQDRDGCGTV